jgi:hypothetical protein
MRSSCVAVKCLLLLVTDRAGEPVDHQHSRNDQGEPDDCRKIERLPKPEEPDQRDEDDTEAAPDRIGYDHRIGTNT